MHRLLQRQIDRYLGAQGATPENLSQLLAAVSAAYENADADRQMIERSLDLMSRELTERNNEMRNELSIRQHAEGQLEFLVSLLDATLESTADGILVLDKEALVVRFNRRFVDPR